MSDKFHRVGRQKADWLRIKEALRKAFAEAAENFMTRLQRIEQSIGALRGSLPVSVSCSGHALPFLDGRD